jgi:hypothetical protein
MTCAHPIDVAILADYWLALLPPAEEDAIELHLFDCGDCSARLQQAAALTSQIRDIARQGSLWMIVSDAHLQNLASNNLRIREYAPPPGGRVECTVTADDDILIGRMAADFAGAPRVDLCICDASGNEQRRFSDIPIGAGTSEVLFQVSMSFAKASPSNQMKIRLVSVGPELTERPLAEYTYNHTRSLPGPGAW